MATIRERFSRAWNAFKNKDPSHEDRVLEPYMMGVSSSTSPNHYYSHPMLDKTIANVIFERIAIDAASVNVQHIREDAVGGFLEEITDGLNTILTVEANIDQTARSFMENVVYDVLSEGCGVVVPVETSEDPRITDSYDIYSVRTGRILEWKPRSVRVEVYNDRDGKREPIWMPKRAVAIIENPFYEIMNTPNSTLKRLVHKLSLLDAIDDNNGSQRLDLLIQVPYVVKTQAKQDLAQKRLSQIEEQLENSRLGIAYIDSTEHVTQLNRPVENQLLEQIEYLTKMLFAQLGISQEILDGTAPESVMLNYYQRTVNTILDAVVDEYIRKFLTKTARTQRQTIRYYRDPFSLASSNAIADIADKFTRNEILSPNEVRGIVGFKPSIDPKADELRNRNISQSNDEIAAEDYEFEEGVEDGQIQM